MKSASHKYFLFVLPFICWCTLFRDFLTGMNTINGDTHAHFIVYQYFFRNLADGVVPLWEPYVYAGRPFLSLGTAGFYNPLLWIAVLLWKCGVPMYDAYVWNLAAYFWLGAIGFYWLCRRWVGPGLYAYTGYLLILFSGIGVSIFNQVYILLIFVPAVWFFVFFLAFIDTKKRAAFLAMVFSLMVCFISYHPIYFSTLLFVILAASLLIIPIQTRLATEKTFSFFRHDSGTVFISLIGLVIALLPLALTEISFSTGDLISPTRLDQEYTGEESKNPAYHDLQSSLGYGDAGRKGTLGERVSFRYLFAHLDKWDSSSDGSFYLPTFTWVVIAAALYTFFDRKRLTIFVVFFVLLLISLGESSAVYSFLNQHVFYFKYFRNLFFFTAYLLPIAALFAVCQFKALAEYPTHRFRDKKEMLIFIIVAHVGMAAFFIWLGDVPSSSYWTVLLSLFVFLLLWSVKHDVSRSYLPGILLLVILVQAVELFNSYARFSIGRGCQIAGAATDTQFQLTRPTTEIRPDCRTYRDWPQYDELWYLSAMTDSPAHIIGRPEQISRWVFFLSRDLPQEVYRNYIQSKIMLFDAAGYFDERFGNVADVKKMLTDRWNFAVTDREDQRLMTNLMSSQKRAAPTVIAQEEDSFRVISFGPNHLTLAVNSPAPTFLVYNDAFHELWKAFIDGEQVMLHRTNLAFKGVGLTQGKHRIEFRFDPLGGEKVYKGVMVFFFVFFIYVLFIGWQNQRMMQVSKRGN